MTDQPETRFTAGALSVRAMPTTAAMAEAAARDAAEILKAAIEKRGRARAIVGTGSSQDRFLERLVSWPEINWSRVEFFHMDEYLGMSMEHTASFRRYLKQNVADVVQPAAAHYLEGDAMEPLKAMHQYAAALDSAPIDVCCLGIGENGHIAFNDPDVADFDDPETLKIVKLDEKCRQQQVGEGHFPDINAVPTYAITLTVPTLCRAEKLIIVVPDRRKAEAVKAALEDPVGTTCPASHLRTQSHATLYLDADSAALLKAKA